MLDGEEYFTCDCSSFNHTLRFVLDLDEMSDMPFPTIYVEMGLNQYLPWYKRLVIGIKYILGGPTGAAYDCWAINTKSDDPERMIAMLKKLQERQERIKTIEKF
jgi:hypothetical protein